MEGPSVHLLAQELQIFVNQKITESFGNAKFDKSALISQKIRDIYAFGKKLIIQLEQSAIITHFLMYGSYRIDESKNITPRIALVTPKHSLYFYNCSTKYFEDSNFKNKLNLNFDILSSTWDILKIVKEIKKHPNSTIDDILLDQDIFAGVGNIIKNEALFLSKVYPQTKIKDLSSKKIKEVALNTRLFSQQFLEWRKQYELKKNLQVYRRKTCPICGSPIIRKKTGKTNRWSFFCPKHQRTK